MSGNEASAIGSMRAVSSGQAVFSSSAAQGGYSDTLNRLALPCVTGGAPFLSPDLTNLGTPPVKSGYEIAMTSTGTGPLDCLGTASALTFHATATPQSVGTSGQRAFAVNQVGTVWEDTTGTLLATLPAAPTTTQRPIQ
jgi:hypothetical protein